MALYYPQGALILKVRWEDFSTNDKALSKVSDIQVMARTLMVDINDYTEADKFSATIDYNSFPFDPRCIRSLGVTICMEDRKGVFTGNKLDLIVPSRENTIFTGFADESSISFDDESKKITIEGRDFTSLFIDQKRVNTTPVSLSRPVDVVIRELMDEQVSTSKILIENRTGEALPIISKVDESFDPFKSVKNQKRKETYWELIQAIISRTALIAFIDRDTLIIDKPQNIYQKRDMKQFIYGGNIKDLTFSRKLGRLKNFNVRVMSLNLGKKEVVEALIPKEARATIPQNINGVVTQVKNPFVTNFGNKENTIPQLDKDGAKIEPEKPADYVTFRIPNIASKEELIKIGEGIYEEMGRQQIEGSLSTYEMEIPEEVRNEQGLIKTNAVGFNKIRNGSAINVYFSQDETQMIRSDSSKAEKIRFLTQRGYPRDIAESFALSLNRINTPFYVKSVSFELSQNDGFTMKIDFINFIDIDSSLLRS